MIKKVKGINGERLLLLTAGGVILTLIQLAVILTFTKGSVFFWLTGMTGLQFGFFGVLGLSLFQRLKQVNTLLYNLEKGETGKLIESGDSFVKHLNTHLEKINFKIKEANDAMYHIAQNQPISNLHYLTRSDSLYKGLKKMKKTISNNHKNEYKRNWINENLAKLNELITHPDSNLQDTSIQIISTFSKRIGAAQGLFYLYEEDKEEKYLKVISSFAVEDPEILDKKIYARQGLAGMAMEDHETIHTSNLPENYFNVVSGLGEAKPNTVVIIPLKVNLDFFGVLEFACFDKIPEFQIDFLQRAARHLASWVSKQKNEENTAMLLEKAETLTDELRAREFSMSMNMDELSKAQEKMKTNQRELTGILHAIDDSLGMAEIGLDGKIIKLNKKLASIYKCKPEEFAGHRIYRFFAKELYFDKILPGLRSHETAHQTIETTDHYNQPIWIKTAFSVVKNEEGDIVKVLMFAEDITLKRQQELDFEKLSLVANNTDNAVVITDRDGKIEYVNRSFTTTTGFNLLEVIGKKPGKLLQGEETDKKTVERIGAQLKKGEPVKEEILNYSKAGEKYWISLVINPVKNESDEVEKFVSVQTVITDSKTQALSYSKRMELLSRANAIIEFDLEGNIISANDNFIKIMKCDRLDLVGKHEKLFVKPHELDSQSYFEMWESLNQGMVISDEFLRVNGIGEDIWIRGVYNPVTDINNKVTKISLFVTDISEEKQLQQDMKSKSILLENQLDTINKTLACVEYDLDGMIVNANQIFLSVTGYTLSEIQGKSFQFLLPENEIEKPQTSIMWQNLKGGQFFTGEFKQKDKAGRDLWLLGTYNPVVSESGLPIKIVMFAQFTTRHMEKQAELQGMTMALKNTLPILELKQDGKFKNANQLFYDKLGYKRMELSNLSFDELIDKTLCQIDFSQINQRLDQEERLATDISLKGKGGDSIAFHSTFYSINDLQNKRSKIVLVMV